MKKIIINASMLAIAGISSVFSISNVSNSRTYSSRTFPNNWDIHNVSSNISINFTTKRNVSLNDWYLILHYGAPFNPDGYEYNLFDSYDRFFDGSNNSRNIRHNGNRLILENPRFLDFSFAEEELEYEAVSYCDEFWSPDCERELFFDKLEVLRRITGNSLDGVLSNIDNAKIEQFEYVEEEQKIIATLNIQSHDVVEPKFKNEYKKLWNQTISTIPQTITLLTDTGGDLNTEIKRENRRKNPNLKSNQDYLEEWLENTSRELNKNKNYEFIFSYDVKSDDRLDIYVARKDQPNDKQIIKSDIQVMFKYSDTYLSSKVEERLKIELPKEITNNFEINTGSLIRVEGDKALENGYLGSFIARSKPKISFESPYENELLKINNEKVDVYNGKFVYDFNNQKSLKLGDKTEILIEIEQYIVGKPKTKENLQKKYTKIIKYESSINSSLDLKWYAWNPEKNPDQKILIEEFLKDSEGNYLLDENKKKIPNPKYDPEIDPKTGTKKQIVFIDLEPYKAKKTDIGNYGFRNVIYKSKNGLLEWNDALLAYKPRNWTNVSALETFKNTLDFSVFKRNNSENYYRNFDDLEYMGHGLHPQSNEEITKFPYKSSGFIQSTTEDLQDRNKHSDSFIIAEAIVAGKGVIKKILGENKPYNLFRLVTTENRINPKETIFKFEIFNNKWYKTEEIANNEEDYFSKPGIWLYSTQNEEISKNHSSFKLLLIKEKTNPQTLFTDNVSISNIKPFWNSEKGQELWNYLIDKKSYNKEQILKISYEEILELEKEYLSKIINEKITITPNVITIPDNKYTKQEFIDKYIKDNSNWNLLKENFPYDKYVKISNVELNENDGILKISFELNNAPLNYNLSIENYTTQIKFKDIEYSPKKIIRLFLNRDFFIKAASDTSKNNIKYVLEQNRHKWFSNTDNTIRESDSVEHNDWNFIFRNLILESVWNSESNVFTINVSLNKQLNSDFVLNQDTFNIRLDNFPTDDELRNRKNIFENYKNLVINLNGRTDFEDITNYLKEQVTYILNDLSSNDYYISNLIEVSTERKIPESRYEVNSASKSKLRIYATPGKIGTLQINVINLVDQIHNEIIDLSKYRIPKLVINDKSLINITKKIKNHIKENINNINYETDIYIENWIEGLNLLLLGKSNKFTFKLASNNVKIINSTRFEVQNDSNIVIDDRDKLEELEKPGDRDKLEELEKPGDRENSELLNNDQDSNGKFDSTEIGSKINSNSKNPLINNTFKDLTNSNQNSLNNLDNSNDSDNPNNSIQENISEKINILDKDNLYDLSLISPIELKYEEHKLSVLKERIFQDIKKYLLEKYSINFKEHYVFFNNELNEIVKQLTIKVGELNEANLQIHSIVGISKNNVVFKIQNTPKESIIDDLDTSLNIDNISNVYLYDLSLITPIELKYEEHKLSVLKERIFQDIKKYLLEKYSINFKEHYTFKNKELEDVVRKLTNKVGALNKSNLVINSVPGISKNNVVFKIQNTPKESIIDDLNIDINDIDKLLTDTEKEELKKQAERKKIILLSTLVPLAGIGLISAGIFGWILKLRYYDRKVK